MYNEGDIAEGPNGAQLVYKNGRWVPVGGPSPITIGSPNPAAAYEAPKAALEVRRLNQQIGQTDRTSDADATKASADARRAIAEARVAEITAAQGGQGKNVSPEVRKEAIGGYQAAEALQRQINEIRQKFAAGPGRTSGVAGLQDYLPYTVNQQFDAAGNAARAFGGPVLGFTASQLNTEKEQQRAMGPYIPQSSDRDPVIQDKINRLQGLVDQGRSRSIQVLGGIPDAAGNVQRGVVGANAPDTSPPAGPSGPGSTPSSGGSGGGPRMALATGGVRDELDPDLSSRLEQLVRSGASADEIRRQLPGVEPDQASITAVQSYLKAHPEYSGFAPVTRQVQNGLLSQVAASPVGAFISSAADAVIPMKSLVDAKQGAAFDQLKAENPTSSLLGTLAGGIPAAAGLEFGLARAAPGLGRFAPAAADALYGGIQGAGNAQEGEGAMGAALGAGAGLVGGVLGRGAARGVGRAASGLQNEAVSYLRNNGVRSLTAGQALGGTAKQVEDQLTGYPFIGGIIGNRRAEGLTDYNRAIFNQASLGDPLVNQIGERGAGQLDEAVTRAYAPLDAAQINLDPQLNQGLVNAQRRAARIPGREEDYNFLASEYIDPNLPPGAMVAPGRNVQEAARQLTREGANQPVGANHPAAFQGATNEAANALDAAIGRSSPEAAQALLNGNRIYRNQSIVDEAVKAARNTRGPDGDALIMPSQLGNAAVANANKYGGRSFAATEDRPFYDLARYGQEVLPSKVGDSGTAGRLALGGAVATAAGGGGFLGSGEDGPSVAGTGGGSLAGLAGLGAVAALGGSRVGQQGILRLLADRPDLIRSLGGRIQNRAGVIGAGGIPLALQLQQALTAP